MGRCSESHIFTKGPVFHIVSAFSSLSRRIGYFVVVIPCPVYCLHSPVIHTSVCFHRSLLKNSLSQHFSKRRAFSNFEAVKRQMLRLQLQGLVHRCFPFVHIKPRNSKHQVNIYIAESGLASHSHGLNDILRAVDSSQSFKDIIVKGLRSYAKSVYTVFPVFFKLFFCKSRRIAFYGYFSLRVNVEILPKRLYYSCSQRRFHYAWRASAQKDRIRFDAVLLPASVKFHFPYKRLYILFLKVLVTSAFGKEIAVQTLSEAEGYMDIESCFICFICFHRT